MDPQLKSILTTVGGYVAAAGATWAATNGLISADNKVNFTNALVTIGGAAVAAGIAEWKRRMQSQPALIKAVNDSDNGVKVVAATALVPQVDAPLKK